MYLATPPTQHNTQLLLLFLFVRETLLLAAPHRQVTVEGTSLTETLS